MEESPSKKPTSSKVIDSLHSEIDQLKEELESVKASNNNYKKKYELANQKNDLYIDQLANAKHENDMINALLKRKERRILDLETEHGDLIANNENLKLNNKNMKIRCDNLQELSATSTAEFERLKIAYDALTASQLEYKKHYESEFLKLNENFKKFKLEYLNKYEQLLSNFNNNDKDIDTLLDGLTNKRKTLDNLYFNKNKSILELLTKLATLTKVHGQETKHILQENLDNLLMLRDEYPDLELKINQYNKEQVQNQSPPKLQDQQRNHNKSKANGSVSKSEVNLDELLAESNEAINSNSSFDEEATLIDEQPKVSRQNTLKSKSNKKKKHQLSTNNNDNKLEKTRTPTPPSNNFHENRAKFRNNNNSNNNNNKRRSMYGNNSNNTSGNHYNHSHSNTNPHPHQSHSRNNSSHTNFKKDISINS